jgi:signal transduction histidine kinase
VSYANVLHRAALAAGSSLELRRELKEIFRRLTRLEVLYHLSDVVAGTADITTALRRLNRVIQPETGISLQSISIVNAEAREAAGANAPAKDEMEAVRSWRATLAKSKTPLRPKETSAGVLVPIVHRNRVQGALRVFIDTDRPPPEPELLSAIGSGCAEGIYKAGLRRDLAESERRLLISSERDRIARDLHDSVGQVLTGLALKLGELAAQAPDPAWRNSLVKLKEMAARGSEEVRDSIYSLLFLDVRKKGLHRALKELAAKFEATTGIEVEVKVEGETASIPKLKEDAMYRVVHEALMNVERHSKASFVNVVLTYAAEDTWVRVRDEGVGLAHRDPFRGKAGHFGLSGLSQLMEEVGGQLEIKNATPRGVIVEGRIPRRRTRRKTDADDPSTRRR